MEKGLERTKKRGEEKSLKIPKRETEEREREGEVKQQPQETFLNLSSHGRRKTSSFIS